MRMAACGLPGAMCGGGNVHSTLQVRAAVAGPRMQTCACCGWCCGLTVPVLGCPQDGPAKFVNHVTGQTVYRTPKPLQWCKTSVNSGGMAPEEVWYHWTLHKSLKEAPHEMPQYLLDEAEKNINNRWWNPKTGEVSWEDPRLRSHWRKLTDEQGQEYYYNVQSGESTREVPQVGRQSPKTACSEQVVPGR